MLSHLFNIHIETDAIRCQGVEFAQLPAYLTPTFPPNRINMANKGPSYGLTREVQNKIDKKYDPELEERLVQWIIAQCGPVVGQPEPGKTGIQVWLKDGCVSVGPAYVNTKVKFTFCRLE